jgi:hypothetical protein
MAQLLNSSAARRHPPTQMIPLPPVKLPCPKIHMYCRRSSTASSAACKILARTTCPTARWRCVPHLQSTRELTLFGIGTPERNDFFPRTIVALLVHTFQSYAFRRSLDRAGPPCRTRAAVKIQFPNIAESVASDLSYIRILLTAGRLLPHGLFLDKTLAILHAPLFCTANGWN